MAVDLVKDSRDAEIERLKAELEELKAKPQQAEPPAPQGTPIQPTQAEDRDKIQIELDTAEEYVINTVFPNGVRVSPFLKTFLTMKGKSEIEYINEGLLNFEKVIRPFMSPDGTMILTGKPSELIRLAGPLLEKLGQIIGG